MTNLQNVSSIVVFSSDKYGSQEVRTSTLMDQFAQEKNVYFFENPILEVSREPTYFLQKNEQGVSVIQPYLPGNLSVFEKRDALITLLRDLITEEEIQNYAVWTDTPRGMPFIRHLNADIIVYDCFLNSIHHVELEKELFEYADVVLTSRTARDDQRDLRPSPSDYPPIYL